MELYVLIIVVLLTKHVLLKKWIDVIKELRHEYLPYMFLLVTIL